MREGDLVDVTHDPLKGVVGRLLKKKPPTGLLVSIDLLGRALSVDIDAADVRKY